MIVPILLLITGIYLIIYDNYTNCRLFTVLFAVIKMLYFNLMKMLMAVYFG